MPSLSTYETEFNYAFANLTEQTFMEAPNQPVVMEPESLLSLPGTARSALLMLFLVVLPAWLVRKWRLRISTTHLLRESRYDIYRTFILIAKRKQTDNFLHRLSTRVSSKTWRASMFHSACLRRLFLILDSLTSLPVTEISVLGGISGGQNLCYGGRLPR